MSAVTRPEYPLSQASVRDLVCRSVFADAPAPADADGIGSAVMVLGAFDGLHLGHRALVRAAVQDARARKLPCVAVTFDPDPSELLFPNDPQPRLLSVADRLRALRSAGVDHAVSIPFTRELATLGPEQFVRGPLREVAEPRALHVGSDFRFGHHGSGSVDTLRELGLTLGFDVVESRLLEVGGARVSSTRIRSMLEAPDELAGANALLGRCHFVHGVIEHGRGEGTSFGFPTANVRCDQGSCMPCQGVYGGYVTIGATAWPAAINVGAPPSFSGPDQLFLEANLVGFAGDVYGAEASVTFVEWLRPSRRFSSLDELERVVLGNIDWVRTNLGEGGVRLT